jgi:hypothetical protein
MGVALHQWSTNANTDDSLLKIGVVDDSGSITKKVLISTLRNDATRSLLKANDLGM